MPITYSFPLRFSSKEQKNKIKSIAKKSGRSLNSYLNILIDSTIRELKAIETSEPKKN